jgi:hypothetical protein
MARAMIYVSAVCEWPGCSTSQSFAFEFAIETFAHLVEALGEAGWSAIVADAIAADADELGPLGIQRRTHTFCPAHDYARSVRDPPAAGAQARRPTPANDETP